MKIQLFSMVAIFLALIMFMPFSNAQNESCGKAVYLDSNNPKYNTTSVECINGKIENCNLQKTTLWYIPGPLNLSLEENSGYCFIDILQQDWKDYGLRPYQYECSFTEINEWQSWQNSTGATFFNGLEDCNKIEQEITPEFIKNVLTNKEKSPSKSDPPLKQFKFGALLTNIQCRDGLQLMIKSENGRPACVSTQTMEKLIERGWGRHLSNVLEISSPKISQTEAIKIIENDLKNRVGNSTKILKIVDSIGGQDRYVSFSEFQTNNQMVPLVFVSSDDTLLTINNASLRINYLCNMGTIAYCGYMSPFNLDYKNNLVYGFDIIHGDNDTNMEPLFYAVDAVSGEIVDSSFLRNEAREK